MDIHAAVEFVRLMYQMLALFMNDFQTFNITLLGNYIFVI